MTSDPSSGATSAGSSSGDPRYDSTDYESTDYETTDYGRRDRSIPLREEYVEPGSTEQYSEPRHTQVHEETVVREEHARPMPTNNAPVNVAVGAERQDGVRWGPIWAGLLTALTSFLLLELLFFWLGWLTLDPGKQDAGNSTKLVTGILALAAFFLGGLIAGATAIWKGLFSGLLHGFMVWALGVVAFLALTFFGASALLGSFGTLSNQLGVGPQEVQSTTSVTNNEANQVTNTAKDNAGGAFFGLALPLGASMLGGLIGSKIWPRRNDTEPDTIQLRNNTTAY